MHFTYSTVLAGLLALSGTLWITQAIPVTSVQPVDNPLSIRDNGTSQVKSLRVGHNKRAPPDPVWDTVMVQNEDNLFKTWCGWHDEPANSGWTPDDIAHWANSAHKHISDLTRESWILAALWIQGEGVAFGSQARGLSFTDRAADVRLDNLLPAHAPVLWQYVSSRTTHGSAQDPKWHAEDVAMWKAAKEMARKNKAIAGAQYPANFIVIYGRYRMAMGPDFLPPCKTRTSQNNNKLIPGCEEVLRRIGITVYNPKS